MSEFNDEDDMTVGEVIDLLSTFPHDQKVKLCNLDGRISLVVVALETN